MKLIEHEPPPQKVSARVWWLAWAIIALLWVWYFAFRAFDWESIALGGLTFGILAMWAIDVSGNRLPDWWR